MKYYKKTFSFLFLAFSAIITAQELPPIEAYLPDVYGGETQNWSVSQADNKYIYVANNKGLLEFNGANWELYPSPNQTIMRSVKVVDNLIYTGCYMNFGFWKKNDFGKLEYTSISDTIKDQLIEDEQFWYIVGVENRVLFQSLNRIYIYNLETKGFDIINSDVAMLSMFNVNGVVYYQELNKGIFKIEKGEPKLVTDFDIFRNDRIVNISTTSEGLLIATSTKGFFKLSTDGVLNKWSISADDLLDTSTIYASILLKDKSFVLGTISKGLIYISAEGEIIYHLDQNKGLSNNTVLSLFEDKDENIWLALDNGINCLNIKSSVKSFNDHKGSIGTIYTAIVFNEFLYLGTNQGLFYKNLYKDEAFSFIEGTNGQVWNLFTYDDKLFCGHDSGTFLVQNNQSTLISSIGGTWIFKKIPGHPDWLMQGNYTGLSVLEKKEGQWFLKQKIKGFEYSAKFLEIVKDEIWINHEYKGIFRIKLDKEYSRVLSVHKDSVTPKGNSSRLFTYKDNIIYTHDKGIYAYDPEQDVFKEKNFLQNALIAQKDDPGNLVKDNIGGLWSFTDEDINYVSQSQFSDGIKIIKIPIPHSLRKEMKNFENVMHLGGKEYLFGTTYGYMIIDLSKINFKNHPILLDKVEIRQKETTFENVLFSKEPPVFDSNFNTISFSYCIPEYDKYVMTKFQYKLEGFYDDWSNWTTSTTMVFENLPFGAYNFVLRTKTGNEISENAIEYRFTIDRPWYFSVVAIIVYSLLLLILLLLMHRAYKHYYTRQREKLVEENKKQLELKELESEREIMKLNNEKLTQDIESKNRELASSTMNIIKKNEILNTIKKELQKSESESGGLKNVERIIDRNLNNKDDWKHFEEAFNSVDKDFLKKLKEKHKGLTPHDLRFCTYLRLNLSSKEIAPLLNISVRSVEIKRYRLRKKLKLEHSDSLVNHILEI